MSNFENLKQLTRGLIEGMLRIRWTELVNKEEVLREKMHACTENKKKVEITGIHEEERSFEGIINRKT